MESSLDLAYQVLPGYIAEPHTVNHHRNNKAEVPLSYMYPPACNWLATSGPLCSYNPCMMNQPFYGAITRKQMMTNDKLREIKNK